MTLETVKVYELAKELGMDSIALIDKLKQIDVDVKSHMSTLGTEEVRLVREHIAKEKAVLTKGTKAPRKKDVDPAGAKKAGTTVIRRRAKSSDEAASDATSAPASEPVEAAESAPSEAVEQAQEAAPVAEPVETAVALAPAAAAPAPSTVPAARPTAEAPRVAASPAAPTAPVAAAPVVAPPVAPKGSGLVQPTLLGSRREGLLPAKTASILNVVKEIPRKPAPLPRVVPNVRPNVPGQPLHARGPQTGVTTYGKEAIDRMVEEEQSFKKKGAAGRQDRVKEPTDVKVADYRAKKELVFLPKKKKVPINKEIRRTQITKSAAHKRVVRIETTITVGDLAAAMSVKIGEVMKKLIGMGTMATIHQALDLDTATLVAHEYGYEVENVAFNEAKALNKPVDKDEDLKARPPIVTVMGHVDHGKTSLLDAIRQANVVAGEAGGITQHIGAYTVTLEDGRKITFIDTPGHEAFTVMRARGANVTDIVILVVAADDGVMPQTREAVDHARAAKVPIIVAVNKIDKPGAAPDKVMKGLSELGLLSEAWGGDNQFVNVSATKKTGIKELLEAILLQAEVLDMKANPERPAEGSVLEARLDRARGAVVTILAKKGTLRIGDSIVAGVHCGRVRALNDDKGAPLKELPPGHAAELLGLEGVPFAGDEFNVMPSDAEAREVAEHRVQKIQKKKTPDGKMSLEELFSKVQQGNLKELSLLLKTDVFGSTEAIKESLGKLATEKVKVKVLSASTGGITESDVMLAAASNAIILGFNVRPETKARQLAEAEKVDVRCYSIIYELLDDVKLAMTGLLDKKAVEKYLGRAEVRDTFSVPKIGLIAGCSVVDGKILRSASVRLLRDNRVVFTGKLGSLKRFKDDAKEVAQGYECGMGIEGYNDIKVGDVIEAFQIEMVAQELGPSVAATAKAAGEKSAQA